MSLIGPSHWEELWKLRRHLTRPFPDPSLPAQEHAAKELEPNKLPQLVVYSDAVPRTGVDKPLRSKLASRLGLPTVDDETPELLRCFEGEALLDQHTMSVPHGDLPRTPSDGPSGATRRGGA